MDDTKTKNLELYEEVRAVPQEAQKNFNNGRFSGTDINPMWRIKKLTEIYGPCGIGWYIEPLKEWTEPAGSEVCAFVSVNLYVKADGEWSKPILGTGGSKMLTNERKGLYVNDECYKMATTDAISVACKHLGFGADIYWGADNTKYSDGKKDAAMADMDKPITKAHIKVLEEKAKDYGLKLDPKVFGKDTIEELTEGDYGKALNDLAKLNR